MANDQPQGIGIVATATAINASAVNSTTRSRYIMNQYVGLGQFFHVVGNN
jgi:hypothetical protein